MGEVITLGNHEDLLPEWNPEGSGLFALVDMGSNGIRFSISDLSPPLSRLLTCVYRERAGISLYDALHEEGGEEFVFSDATIHQVSQTLKRFAYIAAQHNVPRNQISVFATEAMRTSKNRDEMLSSIYQASGLKVQILSPAMESYFGAMGARSAFGHVDGLFMDLGGGSVQMTYLNSREQGYEFRAAEAARSLPYGAAKLSATMKTQGVEEVVVELKQNMADTFAKMVERFPGLKRQVESDKGVKIYFCGGGFRGYGSILKHTHPVQPYPIPDIGGFTVSGKRFCQVEEMLRVNETQSGKIFGMSKRRREQFPAIAAVVQALVDAIPKISTVTFCAGGNRDGVLYVKLPQGARDQHPLGLLPGGLDISDAAVNQWVSKILSALPGDRVPEVVTDHLLGYLVKNTWINLGSADGVNAAKAIHNPLSGVIASLPGLTHEVQAVISLTLCARWGNSLGPVDKALFKNLQALLGEEKAWWCGYIGALLRSMAAIYPVFPQGGEEVTMDFRAEWSKSLGKKGKKEGVLLRYRLPGDVPHNLQEIEEYFEDCGKGLELEWKVETGRLY